MMKDEGLGKDQTILASGGLVRLCKWIGNWKESLIRFLDTPDGRPIGL